MKKYFPWADLFLYGGLALASIISVIIAACTTQEWSIGKIMPLVLVPLAFTGIATLVVLKKLSTKPDFMTKQGVHVWSGGIKEVTKDLMERAIDYYIEKLPEKSLIHEEELRIMFFGSKIEWTKSRIGLIGIGWAVKDVAGLQQRRSVVVEWKGSIRKSALFHEFHHMVDEIVKGIPPDYKHENEYWWKIIPILKEGFDG